MSEKKLIEIKEYVFDSDLLTKIPGNHFVEGLWPLVYILSDGKKKEAYVGETTDAFARMSAHLKASAKNKLTAVRLITSKEFNKSATLDIESNLIKYISGDGQYKLLNANIGLANHTYYQKQKYWDVFKTIWKDLKSAGVARKTIEQINNSDLFKYSPYKSLSADQKENIIIIIKALLSPGSKNIIVEGGAGTGKTILAVYLFKLLNSDLADINVKEFGDEEIEFIDLITKLKKAYPKPRMALVVPMSSFRNTLKAIFRNVKGLSAKMVIGPAEVADHKYDILVVDEAHRLRRRVNLGAYFGAFDKASNKLGFDKMRSNELDWIIKQSSKQILFYDKNQSIKPSDVEQKHFDSLKSRSRALTITLKSQFRVRGGIDYVKYTSDLLNCSLKKNQKPYASDKYEFVVFDDLQDMIDVIGEREREFKLARLVAGYSWKWVSKKSRKKHDIIINGIKLRWNSVSDDWVNSKNATKEVGCIHTTQGYDLNYTGIIFGNEISYDKANHRIIIDDKKYFDNNGKQTIRDPEELKAFIVNIYTTMMLRGIRGTYVFACDPELQEYFKNNIPAFRKPAVMRTLAVTNSDDLRRPVPLYDISAAAGEFSELQQSKNVRWIELPHSYKWNEDYFVCRVVGESMNRKIPNGSLCVFQKDPGGSRSGKTVLVEHYNMQDADMGGRYTVKVYNSEKRVDEDGWMHTTIRLSPYSTLSTYTDILLEDDEAEALKVVGVFVGIIN